MTTMIRIPQLPSAAVEAVTRPSTLGHEAVFRRARKRLSVLTHGFALAGIHLALLHETGFGGASERLAVFAHGLGFAGLGHRRANSKRGNQCCK